MPALSATSTAKSCAGEGRTTSPNFDISLAYRRSKSEYSGWSTSSELFHFLRYSTCFSVAEMPMMSGRCFSNASRTIAISDFRPFMTATITTFLPLMLSSHSLSTISTPRFSPFCGVFSAVPPRSAPPETGLYEAPPCRSQVYRRLSPCLYLTEGRSQPPFQRFL